MAISPSPSKSTALSTSLTISTKLAVSVTGSSPLASRPGVDKIYLPGEIEHDTRAKREAEGVFIEDETWDNTVVTANKLSVSIPEVR